MQFRVFGIRTEVQFSFLIISALFGWGNPPQPYGVGIWIAVVFASILVHELGHAMAMLRYGLQPEITLYAMGGLTAGRGNATLSRPQRIFISFAGPLAGFIFGGLVVALESAVPSLSTVPANPSPADIARVVAISNLKFVNFAWGLLNLVPVLPLDGGNMLESALGPRRAKAASIISIAAGAMAVLFGLLLENLYVAMLFGFCTLHTYQRYQMNQDAHANVKPSRPQAPPDDVLPPKVLSQLADAKRALDDERFEEAGTLAESVLAEGPPAAGQLKALHILAWAYLLTDEADEAARVVAAVQQLGPADPALLGALLVAKEQLSDARKVFESARAAGDERKEIVGPLIQILIQQGDVARAAATALDIVDTLSEGDARQMAKLASDGQAHRWAARLSEAVFERSAVPEDAYLASRSRALDGDMSGSLSLLRRAVAGGFSDAARVWSDGALEKLRTGEAAGELEALLPPPAD